MACAQEGTELSSHISQQCPGDWTASRVRRLENTGECGAVRALSRDAPMESVEQQADHSEGLASNIPQAGTLYAERKAGKSALRQEIALHDREVGASAACDKGV